MRLGSTYLRKDGRWESRLSLGMINGKRQSKSFYGSTRDEAEGKLIAAVMGSVTTEVTEMTVRELCLEWLSVSAHRVKLSTLANYRMKIEKHIIPQFENVFDAEFVMSSHDKFIKEITTAEKEQPADNEELLEVSERLIDQNRNAYDDLAAQGQLRGKV